MDYDNSEQDLQDVSDDYIELFENGNNPLTLISRVDGTYNKKDAVEVILSDKDSNAEFITKSYIVLHNEKYYIISLYYPKSCETSDKAFIKEAFDSVTFVN